MQLAEIRSQTGYADVAAAWSRLKVCVALQVRLRELDRLLVVCVDDIDRLEAEQMRMVLRQLKANANLPNIVFVLLLQPGVVECTLDPVAGGNAARPRRCPSLR